MGEWKPEPGWVADAAKREQWRESQWRQWERLRERFSEFGVELEPTIDGERVTLIQARGSNVPFTAARPSADDERPVHEALHRLCKQLADDAQARRDGRVAEANARLRALGYTDDELRVAASVWGDDAVWLEGSLASEKPKTLTTAEMLEAIDNSMAPRRASEQET